MIDLNNKKKTYECLAFIHQVLTQRTQFFVEEIDIAKNSAKIITEMANKLADDIKAEENPEIPDDVA